MAISYSWEFDTLGVQHASNSLDNVVTEIHWQYSGTTGSYKQIQNDVTAIGSVAPADFVAYESLTKDIVTGWTTASLGDEYVTALETSISSSLSDIINPALGPEPVVPSTVGDKVTPW